MKHLTAVQISIRNHFDVTENFFCPNRQKRQKDKANAKRNEMKYK